MSIKIEYLIDKNKLVTIIKERLEDNCKYSFYALEIEDVITLYTVVGAELVSVASVADSEEIEDMEHLREIFLSELPMSVNISEQTRDLVVWL